MRTVPQENKISFKTLLLIDNTLGHSKALIEMYSELKMVLNSANMASILQSMDQGVISIFKSYYLRNTFRKSIAAIDRDSSAGSGQSKLSTFWRGFTVLDAIKTIVIHGKR